MPAILFAACTDANPVIVNHIVAGNTFSWNGTYRRMTPLPNAPQDSAHPAIYHGTAGVGTATLTVDVTDLQFQAASADLQLGRAPVLALCP